MYTGTRPPGFAYLEWMIATLLLLAAAQDVKPPFRTLPAEAHHILPETTSEESGYFSLSEGLDGKIYVGTAKYGQNAYLVRFDPATGKQAVVLDVHAVCGLDAKGYAAQAKLHTRNFVGASGKIYVGSKQGYRKDGDTSEYPGGYVMTYDPAKNAAENLGMPYPGQGVADVVADERRGLLYVVTCEDQHWMLGRDRAWRELGPSLTPYAMTLLDARGRAHAITKDFKLATYDPAVDKVEVRDILVDGAPWIRANANAIPTWQIAADGRTAWLILMNDARLIKMDLEAPAKAARVCVMVEGKNPDSRGALAIGPDARIYALVRVDNTTGFGKGYLHYVALYDPVKERVQNLGVLAVKNPDYYDFGAKKPHSHGFHRLPDGTLTPLHHHRALAAARDGGLYATVICPFTLLRIRPEDLK